MKRGVPALALAALFTLVLVACGDDDDGSSASDDVPTETPTEADDAGAEDGASDDDATDAAAGTGSGTVTVNGTVYSVEEALSCETDEQIVEGMDRELEAQFFGPTDGRRFQLDLYVSDFMGNPSHDVSWAGPEGVFGSSVTSIGGSWIGDGGETYPDGPIHLDGNRATGSATLVDAMTMEESIEISFDVVVPSETFACR